jgi:hypothetical protein
MDLRECHAAVWAGGGGVGGGGGNHAMTPKAKSQKGKYLLRRLGKFSEWCGGGGGKVRRVNIRMQWNA